MLRKFLETKSNGVTEGGTDPAPRPGDYDLGSLESRAAARMMLEGEGEPMLIVCPFRMPSWLTPAEPLRVRIHQARGGGVVTVSTNDLDDPDPPPGLRAAMAIDNRNGRNLNV